MVALNYVSKMKLYRTYPLPQTKIMYLNVSEFEYYLQKRLQPLSIIAKYVQRYYLLLVCENKLTLELIKGTESS